MSDAVSPTLRRRRLGSELRAIRGSRGMSSAAAAKAIGTSQTKLSAVENARRRLTEVQFDKLLEFYGVPEHKAAELRVFYQQGDQLGWWEAYSDVLPDNIEMLAGFEEAATWVRQYDEAFVPVLLQTEAYAHAIVVAEGPYQRSFDMPRIVEFRQKRENKLTSPGFRYTAVVSEGALWRHVGGKDTMRAQLRHLLDGEYQATVELHVVPFEAGEHAAQGQGFSLITFPEPEDPEMAFVDNGSASGFLERQHEIRQRTSAFGAVMGKVLDLAQSRERIETILASFDT